LIGQTGYPPTELEQHMIVTTRKGAIAYVETTIFNRGQYPADFPVGDIVDALHEIAQCWHFENIDFHTYWKTVDGIREAQARALRARLDLDIENCDICGRHLDKLRAELVALMAAPAAIPSTPDELVEMLMIRIAPHLHAAVEDAREVGEDGKAVLPEYMTR
jgi:hypothetical protein